PAPPSLPTRRSSDLEPTVSLPAEPLTLTTSKPPLPPLTVRLATPAKLNAGLSAELKSPAPADGVKLVVSSTLVPLMVRLSLLARDRKSTRLNSSHRT